MNTPPRCLARTTGLLILATLTLTQCSLFEASEEPFPLEATLGPSDATPNNRFGDQVAIDGDHALVLASIGRAVYFYRWDGAAWREVKRLNDPAQGRHEDLVTVALDRDRAAVGVYGEDVTIYAWDGSDWAVEATIARPPGDKGPFYGFGNALSMDGDDLVVGAVRDDEKAPGAGAAYLYTWNGATWTLTQKLTASDARTDLGFGKAVDLHDDHLVIGGGLDDGEQPIVAEGVAYFFHRDGTAWTEVGIAQTNKADNFGGALALDATRAAISASGFSNFPFGYKPGAVYVYAWNGATWNQEQVLFLGASTAFVPNGDVTDYQSFGRAVAMAGNHLVVGAPSAGAQRNTSAGAVYLFRRTGNTWERLDQIDGPDGSRLRWFGAAVSASGPRFLVGAPGLLSEDTGRAYVYTGLQP